MGWPGGHKKCEKQREKCRKETERRYLLKSNHLARYHTIPHLKKYTSDRSAKRDERVLTRAPCFATIDAYGTSVICKSTSGS